MSQKPSVAASPPADPNGFSLVLGGPLYRLFRKTRLSDSALELVGRRIVVISLLTWLPLLLLSALEGRALGGSVSVPFLHDIEAHVRFLLALPLLIGAELIVHQRLGTTCRQFLNRGIVPEAQRVRFDAAASSAMRLRNSGVAEVLLALFVYLVGVGFVWGHLHADQTATWYLAPEAGRLHLSLAGACYVWVSLPIFQFILLRWYFRLFIWARLLWQISRLELQLIPTHPDRGGGLGFLATGLYSFSAVLAGQGFMLAGLIADRIAFDGGKLTDFKLEIAGAVVFLLLITLGPLLFFMPRMAETKRGGRRDYGLLSQRYAREFDDKWVRGGASAGEQLLGSGDIQSLADLGNSYQIVGKMRIVPFSKETVLVLTVMAVLPVLPLVLTLVPLEELLTRLLAALF